jgi:hypothetical protein
LVAVLEVLVAVLEVLVAVLEVLVAVLEVLVAVAHDVEVELRRRHGTVDVASNPLTEPPARLMQH